MRGSFRTLLETYKYGDGMKCVEVGVAFGENAEKMITNLPLAKFYLVDSFDVNNSTFQYEKKVFTEEERQNFIEQLQLRLEKFPNKELIIADSVEASKKFEDGSLDYVYIDAQHEYANVKRDIEAWWPKVKVGGMIAGHDYGEGVALAVQEKFTIDEIKFGYGGDWWVFK